MVFPGSVSKLDFDFGDNGIEEDISGIVGFAGGEIEIFFILTGQEVMRDDAIVLLGIDGDGLRFEHPFSGPAVG